jgi:predicted permease
MRELSLAIRTLLRQPTFTLTVVITLGLALGVTTGFFGVISALLLRPLPGVESRGLVSLHVDREGEDDPFSGFSRPTFLDLQERSRSLAVEAFAGRGFALEEDAGGAGGDSATDALVGGQLVSGGFFGLLGTRAFLGRLLDRGDDTSGAEPVMVISHALWQKRFGGQAGVLGRTFRVNGRPFTLVGISEMGFRGHFIGFPLDIYLPLSAAQQVAADVMLDDRGDRSLEVVGRLGEGAGIGAAQAELTALARDLAREHPGPLRGQGIELRAFTGLDADLRGPVLGFMGVLAVVGVLVLLVATVNVAGLMLARGLARRREMAVRTALGASRADLVRALAAETFVLFALGGALGAAMMRPAAAVLHAFLPEFAIPLHLEVSLDWRVALFAGSATLISALFFGLGPAARAARVDVVESLKQGGRGLVGGPGTTRRTFVAVQAGLSLVLLFTSALFLRELQRARAFDPGYRIADVAVVTVDVSLLGRSDASPHAFFEGWLERVRGRRGLVAAALVGQPPLGLGSSTTLITVDGLEAPSADGFRAGWRAVGPGYFETLEIPVVSGRDFDSADAPGREPVAVVSRATAKRLFPGTDALGRSLHREGKALRIVGVVEDVAADRSGKKDGLLLYVPFAQSAEARGSLVARAQEGPPLREMRESARELLPGLPVLGATTLARRASGALFPQRLAATVTGACGGFGLLLATVGLYGLVSFFVERKRHELALRAALGAGRSDLRLLALRQGLVPVAIGLALGGVAALGLGRLVAGFVPSVGPSDPLALAGAGLLLLVVSLLAADLPARRAADASPMDALRSE